MCSLCSCECAEQVHWIPSWFALCSYRGRSEYVCWSFRVCRSQILARSKLDLILIAKILRKGGENSVEESSNLSREMRSCIRILVNHIDLMIRTIDMISSKLPNADPNF
jgi:hypothetical protein